MSKRRKSDKIRFSERNLQLIVQKDLLEDKRNKKVVWKRFNEIIIPSRMASLKDRNSDL